MQCLYLKGNGRPTSPYGRSENEAFQLEHRQKGRRETLGHKNKNGKYEIKK